MHETIIAQNIIKEANKQGHVKSITLEIGELAHVPAEELLDCLRTLVKWDIQYKEKIALAECACGWKGRPHILEHGHDSYMIECPECAGVPVVKDGTEIKLLSVRVA